MLPLDLLTTIDLFKVDTFNRTHQIQKLFQTNNIIVIKKIKKMRKNKLNTSDVKIVRKNAKQKTQKEAYAMLQLMQLPDFDVNEFFQTLLKSQRYSEVLSAIPMEKKIDYFAKNYNSFLETQDQLLNLELPILLQIPKAKKFHFEQIQEQKKTQNFEEASVLEIIDSFSSFVYEKNIKQTLRIYQIIKQMKKHNKYKKYFNKYATSKILLQNYNTFIDSCDDPDILIKLNEIQLSCKVYLLQKQDQMFEQINTNLNINSSSASFGKEMYRLINCIQKQSQNYRSKFQKYLDKPEVPNQMARWISKLSKNFYNLIEPIIFEKQELKQVLQSFSKILQSSTQLQTKGISVQSTIKQLIKSQLPSHISKTIEIIIDTMNQIMHQQEQIYEMCYFKTSNNLYELVAELKPITNSDYGVKCATRKGILLINSFILILSPLCEQRWGFLVENVLERLIDKISGSFLQTHLHYWDYYLAYSFFDTLSQGKIRHQQLFDEDNILILKQKISMIKKISKECHQKFQTKLSLEFSKEILSFIPGWMWQFKKYAQQQKKSDPKPSIFCLQLIFKIESFIKQIQYRLRKNELQYFVLIFFEFVLFTVQCILYWNYHQGKCLNKKVFMLYSKNELLFEKAKELFMRDASNRQNISILKIDYFSKQGLHKLAFEIYFLIQCIKIMTDVSRLDGQNFLSRVSKVHAKDQKYSVIASLQKGPFEESLKKMSQIYKDKPEVMKKYVLQKRKQ